MKGPERRRREEEKEDREKISISIKKENPCSTFTPCSTSISSYWGMNEISLWYFLILFFFFSSFSFLHFLYVSQFGPLFFHFLESENTPNLHMRSTGKLVTTSDFANAMPWFMDTMLPTIVISGSAQGPNEIGKSFFPEPGAWFCIPLQ